MKFVKLHKYVACSYDDKPPFLLEMSDNKLYLSNGCQFIEYPGSKQYIDELLQSPDASLEDVTDGSYMFQGCIELVEFTEDLPSLVDGTGMFVCCAALQQFVSALPKLVEGSGMFQGCNKLQHRNS